MASKPTIVPINEEPIAIAKPDEFSLDKFKVTRAATIAKVETLLTALPHHSLSEAKDFARLHPNEADFWSSPFCFVNVPIQGQKRDTMHLIDEGLAMQYLTSARIIRVRLALATKPHDRFFLCHVPSQNLDNVWNKTNLLACQNAKTSWTQAVSRLEENVEGYQILSAVHDENAAEGPAFPDPIWPAQTLGKFIIVTFAGRMIEKADHPGLQRLIGARQSIL
jgi:hypothetical protein